MQKRFLLALLAVAVLLVSGGLGRAQDNQPRLVDGLDTVVGESVITWQQIELAAARGDDNLRQQYLERPEDALMRAMGELRRNIRTNLIDDQVVLHEFKNLQKSSGAKISETLIDEQIRQKIRDKYADKRVDFVKELRSEGLTLEQYRQRERDDIIIVVMHSRFVPEPIISPRKVENYYLANQSKYKLEDQVKYRQIFLTKPISDSDGQTKKRAGEILSQIKGGASFTEMARSYSEGAQRTEGGLIDWLNLSAIDKSLAAELERLKPGEDSGVVETSNAYILLHLEERRPAHVRPLNEVRDEIERDLIRQERQRALDKWHGRLRDKTYIQSFGL